MDLPPVLIALGAQRDGRRPERASARSPVEDLFAGYYETVLARDELIAEVHVPGAGRAARGYLKCHDAARPTTGRRSVSPSSLDS